MDKLRILYFLLFIISIVLGLLSRQLAGCLPEFLAMYLGDSIWGFMIYWLMGILLKSKPYFVKWMMSLLFCYGIEFSQLYKADWIEQLREYKLIALVIGYDFIASDLLCYLVGFTLALIIDRCIIGN